METVTVEKDNTDENDNNPLLHGQHDHPKYQCYKKWNTTKFILFAVIIALLAATLAAILSNIDRMISTDDDSTSAPTYCIDGVYEPPSDSPSSSNDFEWSYDESAGNGPSVWHKYFPQCGCTASQSPMNIDTAKSQLTTPKQTCSDNNSLLQWKIDENYTKEYNGTFEVFHNAHTIQMKSINYLNDSLVPIAVLQNLWQPLNSTLHNEFILEQIHFHWGDEENGSPHSLNGMHYPLAIHFVHYSADYHSMEEAYMDWRPLHEANKDRYVFAVVGVLFEVDPYNNSENAAFDQLLTSEVLNSPDSDVGYVERINLTDLLPHDIGSYYYYPGSMSTPPCDPIVRWHILSTPLPVNQNQIDKFKSIANELIGYNSRAIQKNTNPVYACHASFVEE